MRLTFFYFLLYYLFEKKIRGNADKATVGMK